MTLSKSSLNNLGQRGHSLLHLPTTSLNPAADESPRAAPGLALLKQRRSRLGMLSSLIPPLITSQPADTTPQQQRKLLSRKPAPAAVVQQVSTLDQAFAITQPAHPSSDPSAAPPHLLRKYQNHPPPPPPPAMPPPPVPTNTSRSPPPPPPPPISPTTRDFSAPTSPVAEDFGYGRDYSTHGYFNNNGSTSNISSKNSAANQQYSAYIPASRNNSTPTPISAPSSIRSKDTIKIVNTQATSTSSKSSIMINDGFDFDFAQSAPSPKFDFQFSLDEGRRADSPEMMTTASAAANMTMRSGSPADRSRAHFTASPSSETRTESPVPRAQSGTSTPARTTLPEIQLIGTTPSPEATRRPEPRRPRSISPQSSAAQKLRVNKTNSGDAKPSLSDPKARSMSAEPPTRRTTDGPLHPRVVSSGARPVSQAAFVESPRKTATEPSGAPTAAAASAPPAPKVRNKLFSAGRSRSNSHDTPRIHNAAAWIISDDSGADYNTSFLASGERVPELWNESSNVLVHVHPRESSRGASFKVPTTILSSSSIFRRQMREQLPATDDPSDRPREYHVQVPVLTPGKPDLDRLITVRNLFAFLTGQALVATKMQPSLFKVLVNVAGLLSEFEFSSPDGESYGEIPDVCFSWIMSQVPLADVRFSREKTIEALVLGERMRSKELYHEAFAHAAGKYAAILAIKSPTFDLLSPTTQARLERSHFDLVNKQDTLNNKLEQFDFPALFAGVASSNSANREIDFARWKNAFGRMRSFVLGFYRSSVGNWPPKASSKKNNFSESGLNRQVLKMLYSDLCALYDLMVDRESLSPRMDGEPLGEPNSDGEHGVSIHYLRKILDEYDTSTPPVVPPIPFDIPQIPTMETIYENYHNLSSKEQVAFDKKVQHHKLLLVLSKAYNIDTYKLKLPFLVQFQEFEAKEARALVGGKPMSEIIDQRIGYWLFMYAVIQALPMLIVDSPDVKHTEGVEYFLCQPPVGPLPWMEDSGRKMWFEIAGGGVVELPAEAVKYSVQATYHRSHCWLSARVWEEALNYGASGGLPPPPADDVQPSPLEPPNPSFAEGSQNAEAGSSKSAGASPALGPHTTGSTPSGSPQYALRPRNLSPAARARALAPGGPGAHVYRSSIALGIEPLALPENGMDSRRHASSDLEMGPPSPVDGLMPRSASHGNLRQAASGGRGSDEAPRGGSPLARGGNPISGSAGGSVDGGDLTDHTFEDILEKVEKRQRKVRKWGIF